MDKFSVFFLAAIFLTIVWAKAFGPAPWVHPCGLYEGGFQAVVIDDNIIVNAREGSSDFMAYDLQGNVLSNETSGPVGPHHSEWLQDCLSVANADSGK